MADTYTVTSRTSYWKRLWDSLKGIVAWFVCVVGAIILLGRNENNFVQQKAALNEANSLLEETTSEKINPELDGAVVHLWWDTSSTQEEPLIDPIFWVKTDALKLYRNVEMYQWEEEEHTESTDNYWGSETTTTTYSYKKAWSDTAIDSSNFYHPGWHENPSWKYENEEYVKNPILLWAYTLSSEFVGLLNDSKVISLSGIDIDLQGWQLYSENTIYIWENPEEPKVWDMRIKFLTVNPGTVSVVWKQTSDQLGAYRASNWKKIYLLQDGKIDAEEMFAKAHSDNRTITWLIRLGWLLLLWLWFSMMFNILVTLAKVLPFLADIIWVWTWLASFCLALVVWLLTIWIAWIAVRPVIWISVLVIAALVIVLVVMKWKKNPLPNDNIVTQEPNQ